MMVRQTAILAILLAPIAPLQAQKRASVPIATVLRSAEPPRDTVMVAGRATVASGILHTRALDIAIDDGTAAIRVFSRSLKATVTEGDSVEATGVLRAYRGNPEIVASAVRVVPAPRRPVAAFTLPVNTKAVSMNVGRLVKVTGTVAALGRSEGGTWLRLNNADPSDSNSLTIWVPAAHGPPVRLDQLGKGDRITVIGIVEAYQDNPEEPVVWQIVPRDPSDVATLGIPRRWYAWLGWGAVLAGIVALLAFAIGRLSVRRHTRALQETEERYRQLLELTPDAVLVHAENGEVLFANPAAGRLLGSEDERSLIGRPLVDFVHPESRLDVRARERPLAAATGPGTPVRQQMRRADASAIDVEVTMSACRYHDRPAMLVLARDISSQIRFERDLEALALVDELTGLHNRRGFTLFAEQELARARRSHRPALVVFADLDNLKTVNDVHGHEAGDESLRVVGRALRSIVRESDVVARWGGDEFVALMFDPAEGMASTANAIEDRLGTAISGLAETSKLKFRVSASVGVYRLDPREVDTIADAMRLADAELYRRKTRGRSGAHNAI